MVLSNFYAFVTLCICIKKKIMERTAPPQWAYKWTTVLRTPWRRHVCPWVKGTKLLLFYKICPQIRLVSLSWFLLAFPGFPLNPFLKLNLLIQVCNGLVQFLCKSEAVLVFGFVIQRRGRKNRKRGQPRFYRETESGHCKLESN